MKLVSNKNSRTSASHAEPSGRAIRAGAASAKAGAAVAAAPVRQARPTYPPAAYRDSRRPASKGRISAKTKAIAALVCVTLVFAAAAVGVISANRVHTVFPNVTLDGSDISGMTDVQLAEFLRSEGYGSNEGTVEVKLPLDFSLSVDASEVSANGNIPDIVGGVMSTCHSGGSLSTAMRYLRCKLSGMEIQSGASLTVDEDAIRAKVENLATEVNRALLASDVTVGEDSIRLVKGAASVSIDTDELCLLISDAIKNKDFDAPIVYNAAVHSDDEMDFDQLYERIHTEPQNASYDPVSETVSEGVQGVSFDPLNARMLWNNASYGQEVNIPLEFTDPEINAATLRERLFRDRLSTKSTSLGGSSSGRITNITLASKSINGKVLLPGEEFSYNTALGQRTAANGYQLAAAYSAGETVQEYGGGICQVSSTLYYCALYANLQITARQCHMFPVNYLPAGLDATVSWGGPEFKFVNDRDYPVKIVSSVYNGLVTVELWGTDVDGSYVEITSKTTSTDNGYTAVTTRNVYAKDGSLISSKQEATSTYKYHDSNRSSSTPSSSAGTATQSTPVPAATQTPDTTPSPQPSASPEPTTVPAYAGNETPTPVVETPIPGGSGGEDPAGGETPDTPATPAVSDNPGGGEVPAATSNPGGGETPVAADNPGGGETPAAADNPGGGETPAAADNPGGGETPAAADNPGGGETPVADDNPGGGGSAPTEAGGESTVENPVILVPEA